MVPEVADPPVAPSTDQVTLALPADVNCCVRVNVRAVVRGLIESASVVALATLEKELEFELLSTACT
jgi:hypothetical protein